MKVAGKTIIFVKQREMYMENREEIRNLWSMTKQNSIRNFADEKQEIFREKVKL